jgi:uncharacterized protein (UPF0262 family)
MSHDRFHIFKLELDRRSVVTFGAEVERERRTAIEDLLVENRFAPVGDPGGPYGLRLSIEDNRLILDVAREDGNHVSAIRVPIAPFRTVVRDYFTVCESYAVALRQASPSRIEALDMGRRAVHDDGATQLRERLAGEVEVDFATARRLFTLLCVMHIRGPEAQG